LSDASPKRLRTEVITMAFYAILFGGLLTAVGGIAFFSPDVFGGDKPHSISAASPAFVGIPILLCGLASLLKPELRRNAMHAASILALLGIVGGLVPAFMNKFDTTMASVLVGLLMSALSLVFLGLCVKSFIDARIAHKAKEAEAQPK
jgi:hypothetical protein